MCDLVTQDRFKFGYEESFVYLSFICVRWWFTQYLPLKLVRRVILQICSRARIMFGITMLNVHLLKNIKNNLLNVKKYVFPTFESKIGEETFSCPAGYISWSDLHRVYDKDKELQGNLRKARKLSYKAIHTGNNKQDVGLALSIFDEGTIAAFQSYFPERDDCSRFTEIKIFRGN